MRVVARLRQAPLRLLKAMPAAGAMLLGEHTGHRHRSARRVAEIALSGLRESEYLALAESFGHRIGGEPSWTAVSDHRVGTRKTESLREQGVVIEEAEFVTDSLTDLPTARAAASVVLIGASARTRERYARAGVATALAA